MAMKHNRLERGFNESALESCNQRFFTEPAISACDELRIMRRIVPFLSKDGNIHLIGEGWSSDVSDWDKCLVRIPNSDSVPNGCQYTWVKNYISQVTRGANCKVASMANINCLVNLTDLTVACRTFCLYPMAKRGYSGWAALKLQRHTRTLCAKHNVPLCGFAMDSSGAGLAAQKTNATPNQEHICQGVLYLGLGTPDQKYYAPYFTGLPFISYMDYEHLMRTFFRILVKYRNYDCTLFEPHGNDKSSVVVSVQHLRQLREKLTSVNGALHLRATNIEPALYFDQRTDAAYRLFTHETAELLAAHVPGSEGTALFISAVTYTTEPFRNISFETPMEIVESLFTGVQVFRLWRKYCIKRKLRLFAGPNGEKIFKNRGRFITTASYTTSELLCSAGELHLLMMYKHFRHLGPSKCFLYKAGTRKVEHMIGLNQGKTTQLRSMNDKQSFYEI